MQTKLDSKFITVYFDDKSNSGIGKKDGLFLEMTDSSIILRNTRGYIEIIPLYRVIRIVETDKWGKA